MYSRTDPPDLLHRARLKAHSKTQKIKCCKVLLNFSTFYDVTQFLDRAARTTLNSIREAFATLEGKLFQTSNQVEMILHIKEDIPFPKNSPLLQIDEFSKVFLSYLHQRPIKCAIAIAQPWQEINKKISSKS